MAPIEGGASDAPDATPGCARRIAWADLLRRVFAVDVLECPRTSIIGPATTPYTVSMPPWISAMRISSVGDYR